MKIPDEVREAFRGFAPAGERLELAIPAGSGWLYLSSKAIYAGRPLVRVPRSEISSVEVAERAILVMGDREERARAKFSEPQRAAMLQLSERLSPTAQALRIELAKAAPGGLVRGRVHLEWPKKRHVRGIHVHLIGEEEQRRFLSGSQCLFGGPPVDPSKALEELTEPMRWPELRRGHHAYPFRFRLPGDAPPTVPGIRYRLQAHVDLPFAFDLLREEDVTVEPLPVDPPEALRQREDFTLQLRVEPFRFSEGRVRGSVRVENRSCWPLLDVELRVLVDGRPARSRTIRLARPNEPRNECVFHVELPPRIPYRTRRSRCTMALEARLPRQDLSAVVPLGP